jgi:serine/threonine protein kinase
LTTSIADYYEITSYSRGADGYRAPELLQNEPRYSKKIDIWALGCVAHEIVTHRKAFATDFDIFAIGQKGTSKVIIPSLNHLGKGSTFWERIMAAMLQVGEAERPSASYLLTEFRSQSQSIGIECQK